MSNEIVFDKNKFIRLITAHVEYHSSTADRARDYLTAEGIDADALLQKGLRRIKQIQGLSASIHSATSQVGTPERQNLNSRTKAKKWTHPSVIKLIEASGNDNPLEEVKSRARNLVLEALEMGWDGPPFNPVQLADFLGIAVTPNDSEVDASIAARDETFEIVYNPFQRPTRINFSISHEIAHTLFPDCAEAVRNRESEPVENRQLEQLCNAAAAEIQLPYAIFSHDANAVSPSIEGLIDLATRYKASLESVFIRYAEVIDKPCAVLMGIFQTDSKIVIDYHKRSRFFHGSLPDYFEIPSASKAYECTTPGWTAREQVSWDIFEGKSYNLFAIGISPYRRDKKPRVGILLLPTETFDLSSEAGKVMLEFGDATKPRGTGKKIIAQLVNTSAAVGRGFGYSLAKNYPIIKDELKRWQGDKHTFVLGQTNLIKVSANLYVLQMLAQKGLYAKDNEIPLKYQALRQCLISLRETALDLKASVHMNAIGSGNAGGDWNLIIGMIHDEVVNFNVKVNIYLFPGKPFNPKQKTTLTLFKENSTWETEK